MSENEFIKLALAHPTAALWEKMVAEIQDYSVILLDKEGTILNWNKGAETIKGYRTQDVLGRNFRIFYPESDRENGLPEKLLTEAILNGRALHEGWRVRSDGSLFWGNVVITALHDDKGEVMGFAKVTRDLTERKYAEDLLKEKNRELEKINQELTSFAYVASHDLQEPLRKIQTFASRIGEMERGKLSEKSIEFFGRMQNAVVRMQTLINDLLTYSRATRDENNSEPVDLTEVLEAAKSDLEEVIRQKEAGIIYPAMPVIQGVRFQFQQLFLNLIGNSLKFSRNDVTPVIEIKYDKVKGSQFKNHIGDPRLYYHRIVISDNGIGFEPEYSEKIFEVFQRLHGKAEYSGTGIGLSICKKIVENHRGFIHAEGFPDKGAIFTILIPAQ